MKAKTILIALLAAGLVLAAACGPSEREQEYVATARAVAEEIPLPTWYCPVHGLAGEPEDIKVEIAHYSTTTGEPSFSITCKVKCPECGFLGCASSEVRTFCLVALLEIVIDDQHFYPFDFDDGWISLRELTDDTVEKYWG